MKIGQTPEKPVPVSPAPQAAPAKSGQSASTAAAKSGPSAGVAVTVSATLDKASRGAAADVDVEKVKSVRSAIEQGTYVVNAEAIADKLLANAQEMLKRTHS